MLFIFAGRKALGDGVRATKKRLKKEKGTNMKQYQNYLFGAMCVTALAFSAGAFMKVNAASTAAVTAQAAGQPVDLTVAAERSLPSVVHILCTRNSKVQTVEVQSDPFGDFFSDPFGFFGNPGGGKQQRQYRTPRQQGSGSGVSSRPMAILLRTTMWWRAPTS